MCGTRSTRWAQLKLNFLLTRSWRRHSNLILRIFNDVASVLLNIIQLNIKQFINT